MTKNLYIVDGHYQIFRAYHAPYARLTSPTGEPTKAVHAFCGILFSLIKNRKPDYLAMALDPGDGTLFRKKIDPDYKANREPPPEDFAPQAERIISIITAMNIPTLCLPGYEADDVLATVAYQLADEDLDIYLVSRDKDLDQLVTDRVKLYDPVKNEVVDADTILRKKGFSPTQAIDVQTLVGDSTDNIPGVHGIGPKTAAKLINKYGSAQSVLDHANELTPKQKERVLEFTDQLPITRQLVTLKKDVPFAFDLTAAKFNTAQLESARPIFKELAFTRMIDQLNQLTGVAPQLSTAALQTNISPSVTETPPGMLFGDPTPSDDATPADIIGNHHIIDTEDDFAAFLEKLQKQTAFAFDTETTSLNPVDTNLVGVAISWKSGEGYYIPVRGVGQTLPESHVIEKLRPIFENPDVKKAGHNLRFDIGVMRQAGIRTKGIWFDTLIASFVLQSDRPSHGLKALALDILSHRMTPITDLIGRGKNQITIDKVEIARSGPYAAQDADFTWRLVEHFEPQIASSSFKPLFENLEMPLVEVLADMEHTGVALDTGILDNLNVWITDRVQELTHEIHDEAGHPFNIDSTKQLAEVLFDEFNLTVVRKTKTGRSTDADTLQTLNTTTDCPIPPLVLEYRELTKLRSTYIETLPKMVSPRTGRIHASFHQTGAVTGRLSSSDPNLQNIPIRTETGRQIRKAFVAESTENILVVADYSQIELRVLAHFCKDTALTQAFVENQDIHASVAAQINNVPIEDVTREQRSAAKAVNFGIVYGQSAFGLSRSLGIPLAEAKDFIDKYFLRYPGIRHFIDQAIAVARAQGYVETILGRRRNIHELHSRNKQQVALGERLAVNTVVQGSAADLIKKAMIDIHKTLRDENRPSQLLIQVHDELVFEVPKKHVESEMKMITDKMCNAIPLSVPIAIDIHQGQNWLESK